MTYIYALTDNKGGEVFLKHMKLLMAKLGMNDFSSLSGQMAQTRIDVCFTGLFVSLVIAWFVVNLTHNGHCLFTVCYDTGIKNLSSLCC